MFTITVWLLKKFYEKNIVGEINHVKNTSLNAKKSAESAHESIQSMSFNITKTLLSIAENQNTLNNSVTHELAAMAKMFASSIELATRSIDQSNTILRELKLFQEKTLENHRKLAESGLKLTRRVIKTETEVKEIAEDIFRVSLKKNENGKK